jgi:hypothetical protein
MLENCNAPAETPKEQAILDCSPRRRNGQWCTFAQEDLSGLRKRFLRCLRHSPLTLTECMELARFVNPRLAKQP